MNKNSIQNILKNDVMKTILAALLILNLILTSYVAFFKKDALWIETLKSGGSENFALVQKLYTNDIYKAEQAKEINKIMLSIGAETPNAPEAAQGETAAASTLTPEIIENLFKDTLIKGKQDTRFVILEYSDILCPFCKRHHNDQTLQKVMEKYPNDVALVFKNMPLAQLHPTAPKGAEAIECAGKLGGTDAFYAYLDKAFLQENFNETNIATLAKEVGVNESKLTACVNDGEFTDKVNGIINEARSIFGINGTPGNVILDRETGKYVIVNGAHPFEKFDQEIQNLMK